MACPTTRHMCDNMNHRQEMPNCGVLHPDQRVRCAKMLRPEDPSEPWFSGDPRRPGTGDPTVPHEGDHAGYGFSVTSLVTWPQK